MPATQYSEQTRPPGVESSLDGRAVTMNLSSTLYSDGLFEVSGVDDVLVFRARGIESLEEAQNALFWALGRAGRYVPIHSEF